MTRRRRVTVAVTAVLAAVVGGCYVVFHPAWRYKGGPIYDNGVVSYPRFAAQFNSVLFNVPGDYSFTFHHFPGSPASVMLNTPTAPPYEPLDKLTTKIDISVQDQQGYVLCHGSGFPAGRGGERFMVTSGPRYAIGLWHAGCNGVHLENCSPCTLKIRITNVDPSTPAIPLVPTLEGGGIELP